MVNRIPANIKKIEENFFAVCRYWGNLTSSLKQIESIEAMSTGVAISDTNWVFNKDPLTKKNIINSVIEIKNYYKKLNLRFWWWVYPCGKSPDTEKIMKDAGLSLFDKVPCMAADLNNFLPDMKSPDDIKILPVTNNSDLLTWATTAFHGFEMRPRVRKQFSDFVSAFELGERSPQKLFLAYLDEKPVATSLLFSHQDTAGIYYVSTIPAYRNRGCGLIITQAAMEFAREAGLKDVILQATPMGMKVYKRAGFKTYCYADIYKLPRKYLTA